MTDYTEHLPENKASVSQTLVASPDWELAEQFLSKLIIGQTTAIVFLIVLVSLAGLLLPRPGLLALWPLGGIGLSTGLVSYLLLRRGLFHPAVYTFLVGTCAAITFVLLARGYYDPSAIFYIWPILGAAAALNVRSGLVIATLSTLCYLIIVVVQQANILPPVLPFDSRTEWPLAFGSFTTLFYLLAYFTWLSGRNLSGALLKARQAHEQLEIRVGERTAELANANQELAVLAEARTALTRDLDLLIVLRNIVEAVSDLYPHTRIAIYFIEGEALVRQRLLGTDAHLVRIPVTQGIMGRVARTGQPVWLEDVNTDPTFIKAVDGIVSEICLPLFDQGRTAGVLNVESVDGVVLREADLKLMLALSENVGLAIGRARLYSEARESEARYRQQAANLQIAAEVAHVVTSILDIDRVLPRVVNLIGERFGYYHVSIFLNDPGGDATILRAASGEAGEELVNRAAQLPLARQSIVPWVCRTGQPYVTQDVTTDTLYHPHPLLPNTRAEAVFPLVTGEAVIGALDVESAETDVFTPETTSILATIANQIAIAVHNARLHANIKDRAGELEQAYQDIQEKHERLLISEKMASLGRLTTGIAHEIKTPLGAAQAALAELRKLVEEYESSIGDLGVTTDDHREIAKDMRRSIRLAETSAERVTRFVRSIKDQAREVKPQERLRFSAVPVIHDSLLLVNHALRQSGCTVTFNHSEDAVELYGSPGRLAQVVTNLVNNAIDASAGNGGGAIFLSLEHQDDRVELVVSDQGCGIPPDNLPKIFDPMFTTKPVGQGTGLGLSIVHEIVTAEFGGTIKVVSQPGEGSIFTIHFPIPQEIPHGSQN